MPDLPPEVQAAPISNVQWVPIERVQANDYNPNAVAPQEMRLLYISIAEDGFTQPVVTIWDPDLGKWIIVDGFHRYTTMRQNRDLRERYGGLLPIVVIDKPIADRMAATVRHNRARGKHSVAGMGRIVFDMLREGVPDDVICSKIGLEAEELARLKHITGFSALFDGTTYGQAWESDLQLERKKEWKREHPDDPITV